MLRVPTPRLLPLTTIAIGLLLGLKSVALVRAAIATDPVEAARVAAMVTSAEAEPAAPKADNAAETTAAPQAAATPAAGREGGTNEGATKAAKEGGHATKSAAAAPPPAPAVAPAGGLAPPPIPDAERTVLLDLRQRKQELDARAASLDARAAMLAAAEHRLSARIDELTTLQGKLETLDAERKKQEEANWTGLVKTYEAMRPRDAAAIFNDLDKTVLLPVLDRMKDNKAAAILAAMDPDRAREATAELAQRRTRLVTVGG